MTEDGTPMVADQPVDWLDGNASEPEWPKVNPAMHVCEGCGVEYPVAVFAIVDTFQTGEYLPLVRCADCRAKPNQVKTSWLAERERFAAQYPVDHASSCNVNPNFSKDPNVWARGCDCGATARAAAQR